MLVIDTYRQSYQIDSIFDFNIRLCSYWLGTKQNPTILVWYRVTHPHDSISVDNSVGFNCDGRVHKYKGVFESDVLKYFEFLSKLIFIRLDELNTGYRSEISEEKWWLNCDPYNLNDAIHSLLLDKSYIRDYKLSQLC